MEGSPRERRRARTAQAILDAALEIITERGIDALSIREIAQRIEYSPSGLYEYYAGKDEILDALVVQGFALLTTQIERSLHASSAAQRLLDLSWAYLEFARQHSQLYLLMFNHTFTQEGLIRSLDELNRNSSYGLLHTCIQEGIASGEFRAPLNGDIEQLTYSIWAELHGIAMLRLTRLSAIDNIDAINHHVLRLALVRLSGS
jgi:AcrR family transcriptional regulator